MKAALIRKSTQELIKKDQYPNLLLEPVVGLDEDLEWLLIVNKPIPTYDSTTHKLVKLPEQITNIPHEEYSYLNQYVIESVAVEMTQEEIDADKENYQQYYDMIIDHVNPGGYIIADNVLFHGEVLEDPITGKNAVAIHAFNEHVKNDPRTNQVLLTIRDGMLLIQKNEL